MTGLPNRALIEDRVDAALRRADRDGRWPRLLFIDLDRFKNVNDTLGHRAGDALIRQAALRLGANLRSSDTLGRLGGDEFVVLLESCATSTAAEQTAERLGVAMQAPFTIEGHELYISCSIGIAEAPAHGVTYEQLLQHADVAMFDAKSRGRGTFAVYAPPRSGPRRERLDLDTRLHRAVDNGELVVLYQPQFDLETLEIVGAEALVRWDHPGLGRLTPDQFLPLAEESGLIVDIDRWVRAEAFAQAARWQKSGLDWRVAVNLSTRELQKKDVASRIGAEVEAAGIAPGAVEIEVTDRVVLSEEALADVVGGFREIGLRVAIDDFGTGTSILGRLRSCVIDTLKIDRSFVSEIGTAGGDTILRALVPLGRSLDLTVVAEGIETPEQAALLRGLGCPIGQGYLFSRPVEPTMLTTLATKGHPRQPAMCA
jgi:diguanylate cyclase (GGDEF)-like protein